MNTQNNESTHQALLLVAVLVTLVVAGVVGLGVATARADRPAVAQDGAAPQPALGDPVTLYFAPGSAALPTEANELLAATAELARSGPGAMVRIVPAQAASRELAVQRGQAVRHALEANGVSPGLMQVQDPLPASGADVRAAQRVDILVN
jgi:outer membrane protein OmpA-like peptidoglycan-associated protein